MRHDEPPLPVKVFSVPAAGGTQLGVGFTVINFNTSRQTVRCVHSLARGSVAPAWILVLDNGSSADDFEALRRGLQALVASEVVVYRTENNLGFAAGSNFLVDELLANPGCRYIGLLNNDAVAEPRLVAELVQALDADPRRHGLAGGRMHKLADPTKPDTLGISIYASLMPADRLSTDDVFLGPTGGCCLLARAFVEDLIATTGYFFDRRYFCYCEDTDLVLRANLLGYDPAYTDRLLALHEGQASTGPGQRDFIAHHGWRNTVWMHAKLIPTAILLKHFPLLLLAHAMSVVRYLLTGRPALVWRVYRDALRGLPDVLRERQRLKARWRAESSGLARKLCPRFYRKGFLSSL